jgi:LuxR family maltose regulon positive regulatory protein
MREDVVRRPRLTDLIKRGLQGRLTLIAAPAGSGKSTLVSEWREPAENQSHRFAWLSLDDADNDPTRFFTYFATALDDIQPGTGELTASMFGTSNVGVAPDETLTALINKIAEIDDDFVLGLDDYHVITNKQIHEMMTTFVEHMPPQMHLLITSRHDPPIPLARLRARGELTEIRATDLQFDGDEAATMLAAAEELELPAAVLANLTERTEGWAAGLHLFALSVRGLNLSATELERRVESFSGGQNFVFDYLATEIFEQCDDTLREFLVKTSLLDHLSGPLCDHVTGTVNGDQMLSDLAEQNLFLVPLDDERRWYRYHHLFQDFLRSRAIEPGANIAHDVHQRAAAWLEENGLAAEAIDQARAADDHENVARLLVTNFEQFESAGQYASISKWAKSLPDEMVRQRPRLAVIQATTSAATENNNESLRRLTAWADDAVKSIEKSGGLDTSNDVNGTIVGPAGLDALKGELLTLKLAHSARDLSPEEVTSMAAQALELLPPSEHRVRGMIHLLELGYQMDLGEMKAAAAILDRRTDEAGSVSDVSQTDFLLVSRGQVSVATGRLDDGRRAFEEVLTTLQNANANADWGMSIPCTWLAEISLEQGDLARATEHAAKALSSLIKSPMRRYVLFGHTASALVHMAAGDRVAAVQQLEEAEEYARGARKFRFRSFLSSVKLKVYCEIGDLEVAADIVRERELSPETAVDYENEEEMTAYARYRILRSEYGDAARVLSTVIPCARDAERVQHEIHALALHAIANELLGERALALEALGRATMLGEPGRFNRTFTAEGPVMAGLLTALVDAIRRSRGPAETGSALYLVFLLSEMGAQPETAPAPATETPSVTLGGSVNASLPEPLSDREIEVLSLIASGASNQQIAEQLVVSLSTVKTHINRTYRKLDARSRTQAVAMARQLGIV